VRETHYYIGEFPIGKVNESLVARINGVRLPITRNSPIWLIWVLVYSMNVPIFLSKGNTLKCFKNAGSWR